MYASTNHLASEGLFTYASINHLATEGLYNVC